jgi:hypothetical protein
VTTGGASFKTRSCGLKDGIVFATKYICASSVRTPHNKRRHLGCLPDPPLSLRRPGHSGSRLSGYTHSHKTSLATGTGQPGSVQAGALMEAWAQPVACIHCRIPSLTATRRSAPTSAPSPRIERSAVQEVRGRGSSVGHRMSTAPHVILNRGKERNTGCQVAHAALRTWPAQTGCRPRRKAAAGGRCVRAAPGR